MEGDRASLSESGLAGFHFAQLAVFAIAGDSAKTNTDKRLSAKDEPDESLKIP